MLKKYIQNKYSELFSDKLLTHFIISKSSVTEYLAFRTCITLLMDIAFSYSMETTTGLIQDTSQ
jgi:hypothetical protein